MTFPKPENPAPAVAQDLHFEKFRLSPDGTLFRQTKEVRLPPKELHLLRLLAANAGRVVPAEHLRKSLWGDVYVCQDSLPRCVSSLRAHLGIRDCIQTVYKRGYRFALPLEQPSPPRRFSTISPLSPEKPTLRPANLPRLAILPLATGPGVPATLGVEIAEMTLMRLARMRSQTVALLARDSVFSLAAAGATARQVGAELDAHLALAGNVTVLPTHLRVRVEMIRVADAVQLWIEDFLVLRNGVQDADVEAAKRIGAGVRSRCAAFSFPASDSASGSALPQNQMRRRA
jgi:DNA-binding winged helix-turn-helix (wHTH) protein